MIETRAVNELVDVGATRAGNGRTDFGDWYQTEHPRLLAVITVAAGNREVAKDIVGEAFARALASWNRVSAMDAPGAWTYRVAVNLLARRGRRAALEAKLLRRIARSADHPSPADRAIEIWDAVSGLPPRERLAIALRYAGGLTEAEVARAMGVAPGTASATLTSARRRLAVTLEHDDA